MQEHDRPVRTIKALAKLFPEATRIRVGDIEVRLPTSAAPALSVQATARAPGTDPNKIPEPPISDADLVLNVPAGMLVTVPQQDQN